MKTDRALLYIVMVRENSSRRARIKYCSNHRQILHTDEVGQENGFAEI